MPHNKVRRGMGLVHQHMENFHLSQITNVTHRELQFLITSTTKAIKVTLTPAKLIEMHPNLTKTMTLSVRPWVSGVKRGTQDLNAHCY